MTFDFSGDPFTTGFWAPTRFEADLHDCEIEGDIPEGIDGTFYRAAVDRRYPPRHPLDIPYNADGAIDMFRIRGGRCDFRSRYVRTPRYVAERKARRALFGAYRNRSTNDPAAAGLSMNTANTTPIVFGGNLLALKESSPPMRLDPHTLETFEEYDFDGRMTAESFTAHPKIDPLTGEMLAFSYEARGDLSDDLAIHFLAPDGTLERTVWVKAPVVSMMHDWAITDRHVVLPTTGMVTSRERLEAGQNHWAYDPRVPAYVGIMPRDGEAKDMRWFKGPPDRAMLIHTTNARTVGDKVIVDTPVARGNFNPQFPNLDGGSFDHEARKNTIRRWTFDLASSSDTWQEEILFQGVTPTSFTRMDDRFLTQDFRWSFNLLHDPAFAFDNARTRVPMRGNWNAWYRFDHQGGSIDKFSAGPTHELFEAQFVPRRADAPEGDGWLIGVANDYAEMTSELVIADAQYLADGPVARVKLPFRLHMQVHGWWVPAHVLPFEFGRDYDYHGADYGPETRIP
ncbi:carotenoid oxygenase family protein [Croceibacterium aestuarii]|uniref:carotenoid oxygenase family protein n=1 Tax=Croceibacterium aestuarii TaxID=3064139 RepID=UPI00272DD6BA|nr:carotenoid oxygenase family protein [Croceibacterium sp. D39]